MRPCPARPGSAAGTAVEAFWADLDAAEASVAGQLRLLDDAERAQARRFRLERDRRRFVLRRGLLRTLLAGRLGLDLDPAALRFARNAFGKPALDGTDLRFSASHSHGVALYALARGADPGCDIERCDEGIDVDGTARALFAPGEVRALHGLPPGLRREGFFRCWTRKEAYVKALGLGLSHPLDGFDTSSPSGAMAGWSIQSFEPRPGYHAAVAVRDADLRVTVARLSP